MTVQQYEEYKAKMNRLEPVKVFLFWCGERYRGKSVSKHHFRIWSADHAQTILHDRTM